jgi:septum formation protein
MTTRAISASCPLLLGSASPRRRAILTDLALPLEIQPATIDETAHPGEGAVPYINRVVKAKTDALLGLLAERDVAALLVADTIVVLQGEVLGKPLDRADAERLVGRLVGRQHRVLTRFEITNKDSGRRHAETVESLVYMRPANGEEVARYAATGEGLDKAGAYAVQGCGAFLIERIEGSYSNVIGLPACEVVQALQQSGVLPAFPMPA